MQYLSKYFLDGEVEQPRFDPVYEKFVKISEYEKGLASENLLICHESLHKSVYVYNYVLLVFGLNYEDAKNKDDNADESDVDIDFSLKIRSLGMNEFDHVFDDNLFRNTMKEACRKSESDMFFIRDYVSDDCEENDRLMDRFALYYFSKNTFEHTLSERGLDSYENQQPEEMLRGILQHSSGLKDDTKPKKPKKFD